MSEVRLPHVLAAGAASAVVALVASVAVVADPSGATPLYVALLLWPALVVAFATVDADPDRLPRFAAVFCGSLVGLALLFGAVVDYRLLDVGLEAAAAADLAVNPVMAILVAGAMTLSYYGVFQCGRGGDGGQAV